MTRDKRNLSQLPEVNDLTRAAQQRDPLPDPEFFENRAEYRFLDSRAAAHFLGITPNALRIMVCRRRIKTHKLGSRLRFRIADLQLAVKPLKNGVTK